MLCIFAVALAPERKGQLYKVTGETLEELWNELRDYPQQFDQEIIINDNDSLSIDLLIDVAAKVWDIPSFAIKFLEVTHDFISRAELKAARHALGVDNQEFEELMGIKDRTISTWVRGKWPIPPGIADIVHRLLKEQDEAVEIVVNQYRQGRTFIYEKIYFSDKPLRWNRRVLQRAMVDYGVELFFEDEIVK